MTTGNRITVVLGSAAAAMSISAGPAQASIEDDLGILTAEADLPAGLDVPFADAKFDRTGDDVLDSADLDQWLADIATIDGYDAPYLKGDANLDGDIGVKLQM